MKQVGRAICGGGLVIQAEISIISLGIIGLLRSHISENNVPLLLWLLGRSDILILVLVELLELWALYVVAHKLVVLVLQLLVCNTCE